MEDKKTLVCIYFSCHTDEISELYDVVYFDGEDIEPYCSNELKENIYALGELLVSIHHNADQFVDDNFWSNFRAVLDETESMLIEELEATGKFKYIREYLNIEVKDWVYQDKLDRLPFRSPPVKL